MKELMLGICSLILLFIAFATCSCVVVGSKAERKYIEKQIKERELIDLFIKGEGN
ncbi:MAG: hypothetical protein NSGCLCUN01_02310 [uncultured Clostridium sp.]